MRSTVVRLLLTVIPRVIADVVGCAVELGSATRGRAETASRCKCVKSGKGMIFHDCCYVCVAERIIFNMQNKINICSERKSHLECLHNSALSYLWCSPLSSFALLGASLLSAL